MKQTSPQNIDIYGNEYIHSFSRKQAIERGVLIDLKQFEEFGQFWIPEMACTIGVWDVIQTAIRNDGCDLKGILWDISCVARVMAKRQGDNNSFDFPVIVGSGMPLFTLHLGPGDTAAPVLTLMLSSET